MKMETKGVKNKTEKTKNETGEDKFRKIERFLVNLTLIILLLLGMIRVVWSDIMSVKKEVWNSPAAEKLVESNSKAENSADKEDPELNRLPVKQQQPASHTNTTTTRNSSTKAHLGLTQETN
jgi:hypothetical protein